MSREKEEYLSLQNESDIRGVALGNDRNLTPMKIQYISAAFTDFLRKRRSRQGEFVRIGVGYDSRLSANILQQAVFCGIIQRGAQAFDCGMSSTPAMFLSTVFSDYQFDGAIMITASHLPWQRNGLKFFTDTGGLDREEITEILEQAFTLASISEQKLSLKNYFVQKVNLMQKYEDYLQEQMKQELVGEFPLQGLHIVVDASNGVSGYFAEMLRKLGASTKGSIYLDPDGRFPNHIPNPEVREAMESIKQATVQSGADLGIIFDTDGDRMAAVLSDGREINKDAIIALMAAIIAEKYPGTTVVTDSVTSDHLKEFLECRLGMKQKRFKRGYRNVINEAIRLNQEGVETHLAIETSGHGALMEHYFLDDGAYMAVKIICKLALLRNQGCCLQELLSGLKIAAESREYRISIEVKEYKDYGEKVLEEFKKFVNGIQGFQVEPENYEGIRVRIQQEEVQGWMLLRMSLHDPVMPFNIEAEQIGGVEIILNKIRPFLQCFSGLSRI